MKKILKKLSMVITCFLVFFLVSGLVGCGDKGEDNKESNLKPLTGCMWEVTKGDKKAYLVGTIHVYEKGYSYTNENVEKIMKETDGLAVEVDITKQDEIDLVSGAIMAKPGETIEDILTTEELEKFKNMCTDLGIVYDSIKLFNGYGISAMLETSMARQAGLTETGYDQFLIYQYKDKKKDVIGIEGAAFQVSLLQDINNNDAIKELVNTYSKEEVNTSVESTKEVFKAFIEGDMSYMDKAASEQAALDKDTYDKLGPNRNINMTDKAIELIESEKVYAIAVGTMHYAGPGSVIEILENKGYTVTRLE